MSASSRTGYITQRYDLMVLKKKSHPKFIVPNYGTKRRRRLKDRWRVQRGLDNKKRRKKAFMGAEPTIGYRNPERIRHRLSNGNYGVIVHNREELEGVLKNPNITDFDIIIARGVGSRKRAEISESAVRNGVRIRNG